MAVVSRVVRTLWVDLNAFVIQAISYTGTKRTALVSQRLRREPHMSSALVPSLWRLCDTKMWGTKTGDTLNSVLLLLLNLLSLDCLALV